MGSEIGGGRVHKEVGRVSGFRSGWSRFRLLVTAELSPSSAPGSHHVQPPKTNASLYSKLSWTMDEEAPPYETLHVRAEYVSRLQSLRSCKSQGKRKAPKSNALRTNMKEVST